MRAVLSGQRAATAARLALDAQHAMVDGDAFELKAGPVNGCDHPVEHELRHPQNQRLETQGVVRQDAVMQSGRADDALVRKVDDPRRNDLSSALIALEYLEIGARQLECDRHSENCFRVKGVGPAQVCVHRHGDYLPL